MQKGEEFFSIEEVLLIEDWTSHWRPKIIISDAKSYLSPYKGKECLTYQIVEF